MTGKGDNETNCEKIANYRSRLSSRIACCLAKDTRKYIALIGAKKRITVYSNMCLS